MISKSKYLKISSLLLCCSVVIKLYDFKVWGLKSFSLYRDTVTGVVYVPGSYGAGVLGYPAITDPCYCAHYTTIPYQAHLSGHLTP